jgi:ATP-dependent DNA helicase PIF1
LVTETIYGHLAKFAERGLLDLDRIFDKQKIKVFEKEFKKNSDHETLTEWKKVLPNDFEFNEIRLLLNHFNHKKSGK